MKSKITAYDVTIESDYVSIKNEKFAIPKYIQDIYNAQAWMYDSKVMHNHLYLNGYVLKNGKWKKNFNSFFNSQKTQAHLGWAMAIPMIVIAIFISAGAMLIDMIFKKD